MLAKFKRRLSPRYKILKIQFVVTSNLIHLLGQFLNAAAVGERFMALGVGVTNDRAAVASEIRVTFTTSTTSRLRHERVHDILVLFKLSQ
jgi:hypothetical protein